jgi:hypothetical protein
MQIADYYLLKTKETINERSCHVFLYRDGNRSGRSGPCGTQSSRHPEKAVCRGKAATGAAAGDAGPEAHTDTYAGGTVKQQLIRQIIPDVFRNNIARRFPAFPMPSPGIRKSVS